MTITVIKLNLVLFAFFALELKISLSEPITHKLLKTTTQISAKIMSYSRYLKSAMKLTNQL